MGPYLVSVWGDPDVGDGTFFIIPTSPTTGSIPADVKFEIGVQPVSGRLGEMMYPAERETLRDQIQFKSVVKFDVQELWRVRVRMLNANASEEIAITVEPTPPGYGSWDLLIYGVPFLAVGLLWFLGFVRKRKFPARKSGT
jgi:hypothetical protein